VKISETGPARRATAVTSAHVRPKTADLKGVSMSGFMILRVAADPQRLEKYANDNADLMRSIADAGKAAGATRHAFAGGDGEVLVIDEWPDAESFQRFFQSQPDIPKLMAAAGAQGEPQVSFYRRLDTPDIF
jgi:hypothetical protein